MDPDALSGEIAAIRADLTRVCAALDEFLPMVRAYFRVDQAGPRGWAVRRAIAKANGHDSSMVDITE